MPLVVVGHGAKTALFHRQAGLGAVERLDLRLFVDREHDGVGRRVDVEPDHIAQFGDEVGIVRKLELPHPMGPKPVCAPDALHRADADAGRLGHHGGDPVGRLGGRVAQRQGDHPLSHLRAERRDARWPCLVAQQTVVALLGEALLPAPDAGLRLAGPAHDPIGADAISAVQYDPCAPNMLLGDVAVPDERLQTTTVGRAQDDADSWAHEPDSHTESRRESPSGFKCQILSTSAGTFPRQRRRNPPGHGMKRRGLKPLAAKRRPPPTARFRPSGKARRARASS